MSNLRIRVLCGSLGRSAGSHVYHLELVKRLAMRGHEVTVICFESVPEAEVYAEVVAIKRRSYSQSRVLWRLESWLAYRDICKAVRKLNLSTPDVVIGGEHLLLKPHVRKFPRTPWIYLPHSLVTDQEIQSYRLPYIASTTTKFMYRRIQKWALRNANVTLRFTHRACDILASYYKFRTCPRFIVNGVGLTLPECVKRSRGKEVRLLVVGRLTQGKGLDILIEAVAKEKNLNWRLDIVGDGTLRDDLRDRVKAAGLLERVYFHGFQQDPSQWYRQADLLLFPSRSESLGLVVLEAMSHGVPCLAIRHDGREFHNVNEELIEHDSDGLLANGIAGFEQELSRILHAPEKLPRLGSNARQKVAREFTWDAHLDRYETLFDKLCSGKKKNRPEICARS